jgi:hypothetical protein
MEYVNPKTLSKLDQSTVDYLINAFETNSLIQEYPGRRFALDLNPVLDVITPIIDSVLGKDTWNVTGGNFFETDTGYRVHADTGKEGPEKVWQTFVFPLRYELKPSVTKPVLDKNRLVILNQTWSGPAAFFMRGEDIEPNEYNIVVRNYEAEGVGNLDDIGTIDGQLLELCPHLKTSNFAGLTVDQSFVWTPGVPITFPRNRLHVSSAFPRLGIKKKLGLSIFTSAK